MKLIWTTIRIKNMENSLRFYRDLLELPVASDFESDHGRIVMLGRDEDAKLELIEDKSFRGENVGEGLSIGFEPDCFDLLITKIRTARQAIVGPISPNPHISFYFVTDPDGYTVQLCKRS